MFTLRSFALIPFLGWIALPVTAVPIVDLGAASGFAVLAGTTVTNTGPTVINGDVGVGPGSAITGFPPGVLTPPSSFFMGFPATLAAQNNLTAAYNQAAGLVFTQDLTGQSLGGQTLIAGVYRFATTSALDGILTLDGQNNPNANFVFQIGTSFASSAAAAVVLVNGASAEQVFFQVGSSATLGSGSFQGNILALTSITAVTGVNVDAGRLLSRNGAVTLDTNRISIPLAAPGAGVPELDASSLSAPLTVLGLFLVLVADRRRRRIHCLS